MNIRRIYNSIKKRKDLWNYYNKNIVTPKITNTDECYTFIKTFINASEKTKTCLYENVDKLKNSDSKRLTHIVSTFFLGLWLYCNKRSNIGDAIRQELSKLDCFRSNPNEIDSQFSFVWFMATLFHDLGYPTEKDGEKLPEHEIPVCGIESIPSFYKNVYTQYYKFREQKEHGIWAGLKFDEDICKIRELQELSSSELSWRNELEELYHYVAWIILAHNIWLIRDNDANIIKYQKSKLQDLILASTKNELGVYDSYKFSSGNYPLFSFFCLIDTIDPIKSTSCLSNVDIKVGLRKIIIKSNDVEYLKKINTLNEWLLPTTMEEDTAIIHFPI